MAHIQNMSQRHGNPLRQREIGRNTAREIDCFSLVPYVAVFRGIANIIDPVGPLLIVFSKDIVAFLEIIPDHVNFLGTAA